MSTDVCTYSVPELVCFVADLWHLITHTCQEERNQLVVIRVSTCMEEKVLANVRHVGMSYASSSLVEDQHRHMYTICMVISY